MNPVKLKRCDIFCTIVDNFGDIGVSWRLARQLAHEYKMFVRLWVDDLGSFRKLCPEVDAALHVQQCRGVEVRHWAAAFAEVEPAQLVIEAFACELPERYVQAMAGQAIKPVWINLEYLSAEDWVEGCHGLPSPHPGLPLVKYFFFPGFTRKTGGLLIEQDLLARRRAFVADAVAIADYWQSLGVSPPVRDEVRVSLFSYENIALPLLLDVWAAGEKPVLCLVPEGRVVQQLAAYFEQPGLQAGAELSKGNLRVRILPFVEQEAYDLLLWACDINFVRGEDSCVRAQWAAKPFIWHIYPQHDGVHMQKLQALLDLYGKDVSAPEFNALQQLWWAWNAGKREELPDFNRIIQAWNDLLAARSMWLSHANDWAEHLSGNNLALNLLDFSHKVGKMRAFEIQAGK